MMIDYSLRARISSAVAETLRQSPAVFAGLEGGSAAFGAVDAYSDIDLVFLVADDASLEELYARAEGAIEAVSPITASHTPLQGRYYKLRDGGDFLLVDLIFFRVGDSDHHLDVERHGQKVPLFDKGDWLRPRPVDEGALAIKRDSRWAEHCNVPDEDFAMSVPREVKTERLLLRRWRLADRVPFAAVNADARVMQYLPKILLREESDALADRIERHFDDHGFGLWAIEIPGVATFAGFVGLSIPRFQAPFTPCVEIGWRLAVAHWGHGYATEAGRATLRFGFEHLGLEENVSFTVAENQRSRRVMDRIGMVQDPADDFDVPEACERLRRHVLYRISREPGPPNRRSQASAAGAIISRLG